MRVPPCISAPAIASCHSWRAALNNALHAIEDENLRLKGVFQDVDFNNKERFPDTVLEALLQHFDQHRLRDEDVPADVLGAAYEYLIKQFADDAGKKGGEFYTPKMVVRLIVEMIRPEEGSTSDVSDRGQTGQLRQDLRGPPGYLPVRSRRAVSSGR